MAGAKTFAEMSESDPNPAGLVVYFPYSETRHDIGEALKFLHIGHPSNIELAKIQSQMKTKLKDFYDLHLGALIESSAIHGTFALNEYTTRPLGDDITVDGSRISFEATLDSKTINRKILQICKLLEREEFPIFFFEGQSSFRRFYNQSSLSKELKAFQGFTVMGQSKDLMKIHNSWHDYLKQNMGLVTYYDRKSEYANKVFLLIRKGRDNSGSESSIEKLFSNLCLEVGATGITINAVDYNCCLGLVEQIYAGKVKKVPGGCAIGLFGINEGCSYAAKLSQFQWQIPFDFQILIHPKFVAPLVADDVRDLGPVAFAPPTLLVSGPDDIAKHDCFAYALKQARLRLNCGVLYGNYKDHTRVFEDEIIQFVAATARDIPRAQYLKV